MLYKHIENRKLTEEEKKKEEIDVNRIDSNCSESIFIARLCYIPYMYVCTVL